MFTVGDTVSYPMHGVGVVEAIERHTVLGECAEYYMLRFVIGRITAMVPVKSAESVGLRPIISPAECADVMAFVAEDCEADSDNWNQRYRENMDKLKSGDIFETADVVRALSRRDRDRGLSAGEKKMLANSRTVLLTELAAVTGRTAEDLAAELKL